MSRKAGGGVEKSREERKICYKQTKEELRDIREEPLGMCTQQKHKCLASPATVLQSVLPEYTDCNIKNFNRKGPELLR